MLEKPNSSIAKLYNMSPLLPDRSVLPNQMLGYDNNSFINPNRKMSLGNVDLANSSPNQSFHDNSNVVSNNNSMSFPPLK